MLNSERKVSSWLCSVQHVGVYQRGWVILSPNFRWKGTSPTNPCWRQKTRLIGRKYHSIQRCADRSIQAHTIRTDLRIDSLLNITPINIVNMIQLSVFNDLITGIKRFVTLRRCKNTCTILIEEHYKRELATTFYTST